MNCSITTSDNFNTYDSRLLAQSQNLIESTSLAQSMNAEVTNPSTSSASSEEPQFKKVKLEKSEIDDQLNKNSAHFATSGHFYTTKKLEDRIGGILCCTVCLDLPQASIYQVRDLSFLCPHFLFKKKEIFKSVQMVI